MVTMDEKKVVRTYVLQFAKISIGEFGDFDIPFANGNFNFSDPMSISHSFDDPANGSQEEEQPQEIHHEASSVSDGGRGHDESVNGARVVRSQRSESSRRDGRSG